MEEIVQNKAIWSVAQPNTTQKSSKKLNTKVEDISNRLREIATEIGPGAQMPTVRDLCEHLTTSRTTIAEAFNLLEAEHVLVRKERQGIYVSPTLNHRSIYIVFDVALFSNSTMSPFWGLLWGALAQEAEQRKVFKQERYTILFIDRRQHSSPILSAEYIELLNSARADGCLVVGINLMREDDNTRTDLCIPHVSYAGDSQKIVKEDGSETGSLSVQLLAQQGCTRIGYWLPHRQYPREVMQSPEAQGMQKALALRQLTFHQELFRLSQQSSLYLRQPLTTQEQGYMLTKEVFSANNALKPDGLFIGDDMMTNGALVALDEMGLHVGRDIKIVTHAIAGSPMLFGHTRHLHLLEFDPVDIVRTMFGQLDKWMNSNATSEQIVFVHPHVR